MKEEQQKIIATPKPSESRPKVTGAVTKPSYHPVKDIIRDIEQDNKSPEEVTLNVTDTQFDGDCEPSEKVNNSIVPPKPLPRTSRTNSMCDTSMEDPANAPKPVARPRTNSCAPIVTSVNPNVPVSGGYKVILVFLL